MLTCPECRSVVGHTFDWCPSCGWNLRVKAVTDSPQPQAPAAMTLGNFKFYLKIISMEHYEFGSNTPIEFPDGSSIRRIEWNDQRKSLVIS